MNDARVATLRSLALDGNVISQTAWIVAFAGLTALGAQVQIPHTPVPYTLQTFFVLVSGAFLGKRNGALSQLAYLAAGVAGVPVFSGFGFGVLRLLGPTGGYLLSFPVAAFAVGYILEKHKSIVWSFISMVVGLFIVFSLGTVQLYFVAFRNWSEAFSAGFLIFTWWDGLKLVTAAVVARQLNKRLSPRGN